MRRGASAAGRHLRRRARFRGAGEEGTRVRDRDDAAEPDAAAIRTRLLPEWDEPHPALEKWRGNVGEPIVLDLAPRLERQPQTIEVLSWNLAIGEARLVDLLGELRLPRVVPAGAPPVPLVILAQEAYRADETVPPRPADRFHGGHSRGRDRADIFATAERLGLSLRYAPSMRNGWARSDRGNAILSSCAIDSTYAFSLPYLRQRRVAVACELAGLARLAFVSAHFDNRARWSHGVRSAVGLGSSRVAQAEALGRRIIAVEGGDVLLGADLNTTLGTRDPAFASLLRSGFAPAMPDSGWRHTFHGPLRLLLDHVLVHRSGGPIEAVAVTRVDEDPRDRGARIFGSDHHPLLAEVKLRPVGSPRTAESAPQ